MAALAFMCFQRQRKSPHPSELETGTSNDKNPKILPSILNWIASCFVTEPTGDAVATALSAEKGQITLYIAANRGEPRPEDKANGEKIINLLRDIVRQTDGSPMMKLFEAISPIIYHRFARKVDMILKIDKTEKTILPVEDRFNEIVDRWAACNVEDDPIFLGISAILGVEDENGSQRLKHVFQKIASADTKSGPPDDPMICKSRVSTLSTAARALVNSKFIKSFESEPENGVDHGDFLWILRLTRRLWRVARYKTDAVTFVLTGLPFIRRVLGEDGTASFEKGGEEIKILWVGDQPDVLLEGHGRNVEMVQSPVEFLEGLFKKYDYVAEGNEPQPTIPQEIEAEIGRLWQTTGIKPYLHCELQMIMYLQANNIQIKGNFIGNSKLMCWACNAYVEEANARRWHNEWELSGTSNKPHHAWLIPPDSLGRTIAGQVMVELDLLIDRLAMEFKLGRKQRRRSLDDSTLMAMISACEKLRKEDFYY